MASDPKLVLEPVDGSYVLPQPPRGQGEVIVVGGAEARRVSLRRGVHVARALGQRVLAQAGGLDVFLREVRDRLDQLDGAIAEDSRARLKGAVRDICSVVDWCDAVQRELAHEGALAASGREPIDLMQLCLQIASEQDDATAPVRVVGARSVIWWGPAAELAELIEQALVLIAERTGGVGARHIEVLGDREAVSLHLTGHGEPSDTVDPQTVARFRRLAEDLGIQVTPDLLGPGGAGMVLRLPC